MAMPFLDPRELTSENKKNGRVAWYVYHHCIDHTIILHYSYFCFLHSFLFRSGYLDKGSYLIVPSTTGCKLKKRRAQPSTNVQLASHLKFVHLHMAKMIPIFYLQSFNDIQRFT